MSEPIVINGWAFVLPILVLGIPMWMMLLLIVSCAFYDCGTAVVEFVKSLAARR